MNNSEILYLYDAKFTNPNGDPDEENRPRMDYEKEINLVSDLRLKRYIRDYMEMRGYNLFVMKLDDKPVTAEKRIAALKDTSENNILKELIDVRLFGATMPIKKETKTFIGPVQFNWGYSLNKVELLENSITSHFSTGEGKEQGAIGKDYRVKYSLIAFSGVVSGKRAEKTKLTEEDVSIMDNAMKHAIPELATRSKIGQYPRLYMRVEYKDNETVLGDMRDYISLIEKEENIRGLKEFYIDITNFKTFLEEYENKILKIHYFADENLELRVNDKSLTLKEALNKFELDEVK